MTIKHLFLLLVLFANLLPEKALRGEEKNQSVREKTLSLSPIGYWPVDAGGGKVIEDYSHNENHAVAHNLSWKYGYVKFDGFNQWIEIDPRQAYDTTSVSLGGWVWSEADYGSKGVTFFGNAYRHSGLTLETLDEKIEPRNFGDPSEGIGITLTQGGFVHEVGNEEKRAVSVGGGSGILVGRWQHVAFTYEAGIAKFYLDGECISEASRGDYVYNWMPFIVGIQAEIAPVNQWWNVSLKGSVRELVLFDRALKQQEVELLAEEPPSDYTEVSIKKKVRKISFGSGSNDLAASRPNVDDLIDKLSQASEAEKLGAVRALAEEGELAREALPVLCSMLAELYDLGMSSKPLRSEDGLRNALIWALQEIGEGDEESIELLSKAYAKPFLDSIDLSTSQFSEIRELHESGRYWEALLQYREVPHLETLEITRSGELPFQGKVNMKGDHIYSPILHYNGSCYIAGVEWVPEEEAAALRKQYEWDLPEKPMLARTIITQIMPNGEIRKQVLEGRDFIYMAYDTKMLGWSLGVDPDGFLHLVGGLHNFVQPERYAPGTLEKLDLSRNFEDPNFPTMMYWVSREPGDIESFEFVGQRENSRNIPVLQGLNYMPFVNSREGVLYTYGRIYVQGMQSIGAYRYAHESQRWVALGGTAPDMKREDPTWANHQIVTGDQGVIRSMRVDTSHVGARALVWDRGTSWYNFSRGMIRFDKMNRMHLAFPIRSVGADGKMESYAIYAYSDDGGDSFYRANGDPIAALPLSASPGPNQADVVAPSMPVRVYFDGNGLPGVIGDRNYYWHYGKSKWVHSKIPLSGILNAFTDSAGLITFRNEGGPEFFRIAGHGLDGVLHRTNSQLPFNVGKRDYENNISWQNVYDQGDWFSIQTHTKDRTHHPEIFEFNFSSK